MNTLNPDEICANYIAIFGQKDGPVIQHITQQVANLALRWRVFLYLYCGPHERVNTLNESSGFIAKMLHDLIWDDTLLRIRQLSDHAKQWKGENLSLPHLVTIAKKKGIDLSSEYQSTAEICAPARAFVDKRIAHLDLAHVLGDIQTDVNRAQTTEAVKAICRFVRTFHSWVRNCQFSLMPLTFPDETQFLLRLYQGVQSEKVLEAAARQAFMDQHWTQAGVSLGYKRPDIPEWVHERDDPLGDI